MVTNYYTELNINKNLDAKGIQEYLNEEKKKWSKKLNSPNLDRRQEAERKLALIAECSNIFDSEEHKNEYDIKLAAEETSANQSNASSETQYNGGPSPDQWKQYGNSDGGKRRPYQSSPDLDPNRSPYGTQPGNNKSGLAFDKKVTSVVAYLSFLGWLIAFIMGDKQTAKYHLNQALNLNIFLLVCNLLASIKFFQVLSLAFIVVWLVDFVFACKGEDNGIPPFNMWQIIK